MKIATSTMMHLTYIGAGPIDFGAISIPASGAADASTSRGDANMEDPAVLRDMLLQNPHDVAILKERNPALAEALLSGNLGMECTIALFHLLLAVDSCS